MLAFWQEQALVPFGELLKLGGGVHQHRHDIGDSILKINHSRTPIAQGNPTGLQALTVFTHEVDDEIELLDPDGNEVCLAPGGAHNLRLRLGVNNLDRSIQFYNRVLELPSSQANVFDVGASQIELVETAIEPFERQGIGYRYMTFQVFDVVATHAAILAAGGQEGSAPGRLGDVAYISFVQDPDGNWIEISQRKSITGSLE